jgi:hypothetical protein
LGKSTSNSLERRYVVTLIVTLLVSRLERTRGDTALNAKRNKPLKRKKLPKKKLFQRKKKRSPRRVNHRKRLLSPRKYEKEKKHQHHHQVLQHLTSNHPALPLSWKKPLNIESDVRSGSTDLNLRTFAERYIGIYSHI